MKFFARAVPGFALIDAVLALSVAALLISALVSVAATGAGLVATDKAKTTATELLSQKLEAAALISYSALGTAGGVPSGSIPQSELVNINGFAYTVTTAVGFVDDAQNGVGNDYKTMRVTVSWAGQHGSEQVSAVTYRAP